MDGDRARGSARHTTASTSGGCNRILPAETCEKRHGWEFSVEQKDSGDGFPKPGFGGLPPARLAHPKRVVSDEERQFAPHLDPMELETCRGPVPWWFLCIVDSGVDCQAQPKRRLAGGLPDLKRLNTVDNACSCACSSFSTLWSWRDTRLPDRNSTRRHHSGSWAIPPTNRRRS